MSEARRYVWASLVVESDMALPELPRSRRAGRPDIVVRRAVRRAAAAGGRRHQWRLPDGTRWASVVSGADEHRMRFQRFAEFVVASHGRSIAWRAPAKTRPETLRHLLLDQVLPAVAAGHAMIGLHASAVDMDGAVAFAGP
ncbi:MAG: hypothetical protein ACHQO8_10685, partial [Vicinamibacterales bacterium]